MGKTFDSDCFRKTPQLMKLGEDNTLGHGAGLSEHVEGKAGQVSVQTDLCLWNTGLLALDSPNTTVLFETELLDFLGSVDSDNFCALSSEQQNQFPLQKVLKVAATEREFGNYLFRQNRFYDAKVRYKRVRILKKCV